MHLSLSLFGVMNVTWDAHPITFPTTATRALLAYLALEADRPHAREVLASLLWPEQSQHAAVTNFRQTLARLRKVLPSANDLPLLSITSQTIQLRSAHVSSDVAHFDHLVSTCAAHIHVDVQACPACVAQLHQAATLYRGEVLQGLFLERSQPFEDWLRSKREAFHQQALDILQVLTRVHEAARDYSQMRLYASRQLALDPLQEEAHIAVMRALALAGDRNAALVQYERYCHILATELGIEPQGETRALYEQIRAEVFPPAQHSILPPHNLPAPVTMFVGRDAELATLLALANRPETRLLTVVGAGGMGKTRLALEFARQQLPTFADGAYFVSLAPLTTPSAIISTIAMVLGVTGHGGNPRLAVLHHLRDTQMLLILDNFEHLLDGADIVVDILEAAPHVTIITTSRERLNIRGEQQFVLHGIAYPVHVSMTTGTDDAAVRLFVQSAQRVQPGFALSAANVTDVIRICALVQGMPLGLELAAAWTETLPVWAIAREIEQSADFLMVTWREVPERQRSIRAVFNWSWHLLRNTERHVFTHLSVFRGGFTREAAQVVAGASPQVLSSLQRKSLLRWNVAIEPDGRYDIHELLRQFAAEQLAATPDTYMAVMARHSAFYLALAEAAVPMFYSPEQVVWLNRIEREHDNIRTALDWLDHHGDVSLALRLAGALRYFWFVRGYHHEGAERLKRLLFLPTAGEPTSARVRALNAAGYLEWVRGNVREAHVLLDEARTISRTIDDRPGLAFALCYLGAVTNAQGAYPTAYTLLAESLTIWQTLGETNNIGLALMFLGDALIGRGEDTQAAPMLAESANLFRHAGNTSVLPYPLRRLGYLAQRQGQWNQAAALYTESMQLNANVGDRQGIAASVVGLASVAAARETWERAAAFVGAAEALVASIRTQLLPFDRQQRSDVVMLLRSHLADSAFDAAIAEGQMLAVEQGVDGIVTWATGLTQEST